MQDKSSKFTPLQNKYLENLRKLPVFYPILERDLPHNNPCFRLSGSMPEVELSVRSLQPFFPHLTEIERIIELANLHRENYLGELKKVNVKAVRDTPEQLVKLGGNKLVPEIVTLVRLWMPPAIYDGACKNAEIYFDGRADKHRLHFSTHIGSSQDVLKQKPERKNEYDLANNWAAGHFNLLPNPRLRKMLFTVYSEDQTKTIEQTVFGLLKEGVYHVLPNNLKRHNPSRTISPDLFERQFDSFELDPLAMSELNCEPLSEMEYEIPLCGYDGEYVVPSLVRNFSSGSSRPGYCIDCKRRYELGVLSNYGEDLTFPNRIVMPRGIEEVLHQHGYVFEKDPAIARNRAQKDYQEGFDRIADFYQNLGIPL